MADDSVKQRRGLCTWLASKPGLKIVGEVDDEASLHSVLKEARPDVVVMDVLVPGSSTLRTLRRLVRRYPRTHFVVRTVWADERFVREARRNGVGACIPRMAGATELLSAVRGAVKGRLAWEGREAKGEIVGDRASQLTPRESDVLKFVAEGLTRREIALQLGISPRTVEAHRANIIAKLGLRTQVDLIRYALRTGLVAS